MVKTDQNLKILEKKIRQAVNLLEDLRKGGAPADEPSPPSRKVAYGDLPLLRGLDHAGEEATRLDKLVREREQLRERLEKIIEEIEKVIG